jgi:SAM-dependent methyltransferase
MNGSRSKWLRRLARDAHQLTHGWLMRIRKRDTGAYCPCCGVSQVNFRDCVMSDRQCWVCGSLERHRLVALWLEREPQLLRAGMSTLHVAPEPAIARRLRRVRGVQYVSGDLTAEFGPERIDVTDLRYASESFDAVICNHVLEHVPDDRRAIGELRRVLKPGGWALLLVPDVQGPITEETPGIVDPEEMLRLYGQADHVRRYGWDYVDRLAEGGFQVEVIKLEASLSSDEIARLRLRKFGEIEPLFVGRRP